MAATALARTSSVNRLAEAAQSYRSRLTGLQRRAREAQASMIAKGEAVMGGAAAGALDALMSDGGEAAEVMGVPVAPVVGGLCLLAGFAGNRVVPGADHIGNFGVGVLAYWTGNVVRDQVEEAL